MQMLNDYELMKIGKLKEYLSCFFSEKLYREYKKEEDKFRAKIKGSDDLSLRSLTYRIIPMKKFLIYYLSGDHINVKSDKIKEFYTAIVDQTMMKKLEDSRTINWWTDFCPRLYVGRTKTDTNDTLYASASIAMWGFEDSKSLLKYCKYEFKNNLDSKDVKSRYKLEMRRTRGHMVNDSILDRCYANHNIEKDETLLLLKNLDADFNAYILSNALRRPIIIFETTGGYGPHIRVYLPLSYTSDECCKDPLILAYYFGKYYPILQIEHEPLWIKRNFVPLDRECLWELADICFNGFRTEMEKMRIFESYMNVVIRHHVITTDECDYHVPRPYTCVCIGMNDPSYYRTFKEFKMREIGMMDNF